MVHPDQGMMYMSRDVAITQSVEWARTLNGLIRQYSPSISCEPKCLLRAVVVRVM